MKKDEEKKKKEKYILPNSSPETDFFNKLKDSTVQLTVDLVCELAWV